MNARAVAAWSASCLVIVLSTTNPVYKVMVLAAALSALAAGAGLRRIRGLLIAVLFIAAFAMLLNFVSAHLGATVLFALPAPLSRTGVAIAASLNLVPAVATSFVQVSEAQRLRGWRPRGPRSWMEVVVPVVLSSVEGSIQLAESMEARGFGSGPRTAVESTSLQRSDWMLVAASGLALMAFAVSHAAGWAADWFPYPMLSLPAM